MCADWLHVLRFLNGLGQRNFLGDACGLLRKTIAIKKIDPHVLVKLQAFSEPFFESYGDAFAMV